jgi:drug/metabolite transporter (DMT)-like permease
MSSSDEESVRTRALAAVGLTVVLWGASPVLIKAVQATGLVTAFYRLWLAIPFLWVIGSLQPGFAGRLDRHWLRASLIGGLMFGVHQILFFCALKWTSVANVTVIGALQPALVLLVAGSLFGEHATVRAIAWASVAVLGTSAVALGGGKGTGLQLAGDALAVLNLLAFTTYFVASKRFRVHTRAWEYTLGMTTVAGLVVAVVCVLTAQDFASPSGNDWLILFVIGALPGTLGHVLTNWAHAHTSAFAVSNLLLAAPVLSTAFAWIALGESLRAPQLAGGLVALAGIAMVIGSTRSPELRVELAEGAAETDAP